MKRFIDIAALCVAVFLATTACNTSKTIELLVSVEGNDSYTGNVSDPFATIWKAVEALRDLRKSGNSNPEVIYLRDGRHQLDETQVPGIEPLDVSKMGLLYKDEKPGLPVSSALVLDLNADRGLTIEDDSMVSAWTNQAADPLAVDFKCTEEGRTRTIITQEETGKGRPTLLKSISEINGHNSLIFTEDELINENDEAFHGMITGAGYTWFAVIKPYALCG